MMDLAMILRKTSLSLCSLRGVSVELPAYPISSCFLFLAMSSVLYLTIASPDVIMSPD